jgi:hypothetical protein
MRITQTYPFGPLVLYKLDYNIQIMGQIWAEKGVKKTINIENYWSNGP